MLFLRQTCGLLLILLAVGMICFAVMLLMMAGDLLDLVVSAFTVFVAFLPLSVGHRWSSWK